ncbi:hypothetical protein [Streptomyces clavuligerus]|uniref:Uncharacterized protein n=1 Tax=Streptomyces clavuligerus TaxID=1901 RepID=B5GN69_STRCL|nr:hypothetical protein [Streptomyces clavuligerus]ANW22187.1 hypothetical protein BB341_28020 [Streptomyces clavuligerus]AXU17079.1 hypothetical protein D1794_31075 [Streptomyces clavuligerus]EDY47765.1 hypothetical protein SSCG_00793 [Streptomyces clavuligerus]EFG04246.1 Hypothetical protein SCLAV_p0759 [Streptomyces clavuligerus]MBY6307277.1 hypothetical protein [Streptomyces clavuligerus]
MAQLFLPSPFGEDDPESNPLKFPPCECPVENCPEKETAVESPTMIRLLEALAEQREATRRHGNHGKDESTS